MVVGEGKAGEAREWGWERKEREHGRMATMIVV